MPVLKTGKTSVALVVLILVVGVAAYFTVSEFLKNASSSKVVSSEGSYAFEATNKTQLVAHSTNVFLGRVTKKVGTKGEPVPGPHKATPDIQFSVVVLRNIKGKLSGTVVVNQHGGYDPQSGNQARLEGDPLLIPGREFLFSTNYDAASNRYQVVAQPFGDVHITGVNQRAELIHQFKAASSGR